MNVDYGGSQPNQGLTKITSLDGICDPFYDNTVNGHVKLGDDQDMCFPNLTTVNLTNGPL